MKKNEVKLIWENRKKPPRVKTEYTEVETEVSFVGYPAFEGNTINIVYNNEEDFLMKTRDQKDEVCSNIGFRYGCL